MSDKHPAPWKWDASSSSPRDPGVADFLRDGGGNIILSADVDEDISIASPVARELIRLAPEMETLLRSAVRPRDEDDERGHNVCFACEATIVRGDLPEHFDDCPVVAVLAAIDTSRED